MVDFESVRFQGDPVLLSILNSPDDGSQKLKKGSPADSVTRVQRALLDLHWARQVAAIAEADFVDGDYGPATVATVAAYKRNYGITFPPGDPSGVIDGFTGPRTLQQLDFHMVVFDEAVAAIEAKAADLQAGGLPVELVADADSPATFTIEGTPGAGRMALIDGTTGEVVFTRATGAHEVHGAIYIEWIKRGYVTGPLGFPISDELDAGDGLRLSQFQGGTLHFNVVTGRLGGTTAADGVRRTRDDVRF